MSARFIDTSIWDEDWFCDMGGEYQIFWSYITCKCNNAGIWKPNKIDFEIKSRTKINMVAFLEKVNERGCKDRIIVTDSGRWFITGFIAFQWFNKKKSFDLVLSNKLHRHIYDLLIADCIPLEKVRGLEEVLGEVLKTSKDKDKECISVLGENSEKSKKPPDPLEGSPLKTQPLTETLRSLAADFTITQALGIKGITPAKAKNLFNNFYIWHMQKHGDVERTYTEVRSHFNNWLNMMEKQGILADKCRPISPIQSADDEKRKMAETRRQVEERYG